VNFADAIRKASHQSDDLAQVEEAAATFDHQVEAQEEAQEPTTHQAYPAHHSHVPAMPAPEITLNHDPSQPGGGTSVRFEMFLTPEQLSSLLRAVVANQHTVMTLREAATHMRISTHALEDLAKTGEIPAFLVDGKWRFPRAGVDEWIALQIMKKEAC
jgi:excisionase family DNA binding protein